MRVTRLLGATALTGALVLFPLGVSAAAAPVQESVPVEAAAQEDENPSDDTQDVVVTGSRIRTPNLTSAIPVTTVTGDEFFETGQVSIGDVLNELPQLRSTFSQQNSTRFLGTRGLNLLDLRGLGTQRTLVLQNGRRHVPGDVLNNAVSPDVNTFPTDLIERVDVTTGGNSAIYGSDAIAGVVNFILKDDFEGLQVRGQSGVSKYEDAGNQYVSLLAGKNFSEGRGNIAVNLEYAHQERYFANQRPSLRQANGFVVVDTDPAGSPLGSDGVADRQFFRDIRSSTISLGGLLQFGGTAAARFGRDPVGGADVGAVLFQPDGTLVPQAGGRVGLAPNGSFIGGNGFSGREGQLIALSPQLDRYSVNVLGKFEVSPAFVPFVEAKYVRSEAFGSVSGPLFSQGATLGDFTPNPADPTGATFLANREQPRLDNPFLSAQARAVITEQRALSGQTSSDATRIALRRNFVELGIRDEQIRRETYRAVVGVRGDFLDDWNYEVSANYGEHRERNQIQANINVQRYLLAIDTVRNPAGQIVCRSQVDPAAAYGLAGAGDNLGAAQQAQILAADVAACQPLNPFGEGNISPAARAYLTTNSLATGKIKQFVGSGFVAGDFSNLFELPGGPIGFSVGAEYRRERVSYDLDDLTQAGYAFYNAIPAFRAPAFEVKEAFGEIRVPLLKDLPFIKELTLSGSGRVADYKGATGTVYAYDGRVEYSPVADLRFRAAYSRSVRAPNLTELFSAESQNFAPAPADPCSARNIGTGSANRAANCSAAGRPANYDFVYQQSLEIRSGGNALLTEEKSTSYTIGGVFQPTFAPGFSMTVDYFDITVDDVISSVSAQDIINNCYDAANLDNAFCQLFQRAGTGGGSRGEVPFQILEGSLLQSSLNFAQLKARGIDTAVSYRTRFDGGTFGINAIWTRTLQRDQFLNVNDPNRADRLMLELGDPRDQVNLNMNVGVGPVTFGYQARFIGKQILGGAAAGGTYESQFQVQGRAPENADYASVRFYPNVYYHDARVDLKVNDKFNIYAGVDNIGNQLPPFGLTGVTDGGGIYDNRGRYGYIGVVANF
jgi:outer membrane receptor protein involved in Fe transport